MKKRVINRSAFWLSCLTLLFGGCSTEPLTGEQGSAVGSPVEMRLQVNAPLGDLVNNETDINRLRMVIFGSLGSSDAGKLILNKYYDDFSGTKLREIITAGKRDIYIIVNEPLTADGAELESYTNIAEVADIRALSLTYHGTTSIEPIYTPTEIPMFLALTNQLIKADLPNNIEMKVERTMAKVTMKLNIKNDNFLPFEPVVIDNIQIKNLPKESYWIAKNYTGDLVASENQGATTVAAVSGYDLSYENTFYVPEYIFNDPPKGAYIEITGHVNSDQNRINKWTVKLGDAMDASGKYDKYHITRNRHYIFTGDVQSYGEMDDLDVKVTVKPWTTVTQDEVTGRYVSFKEVTNGSQPIVDGSNLDVKGTPLVVSCETNIGGWYTITRDMNGKLVQKSDTTSTVLEKTTQAVILTIPPLAAQTDKQTYTVSIYHPTIAQDVGPIKSLTFTQGGVREI